MDCHFKLLSVLATDTAQHTALQNVSNKCPFKVKMRHNSSLPKYFEETCQTSVNCSTSFDSLYKPLSGPFLTMWRRPSLNCVLVIVVVESVFVFFILVP
jgi:hypothetical protein